MAKTPNPKPGPKPTPTPKPTSAPAKLTLQQQSDRSRTASRAAFQATPAKQERNKLTQAVISANKKVEDLKAAANKPGLTLQQKSDRSRTLGRAKNQQAKAKDALNTFTGYKKPDPKKPDPKKPDPKKPDPKKPKSKGPVKKKKKIVKKTTSTGTNQDNNTDTTEEENQDTGGGDVSATPETPESGVSGDSETPKTYKPATPDLILLQEEAFPEEVMTDLLFEDIGGTEILNLARHDLVSGIDIKYQQISNLAKIENIYGGANLIALQSTSEQVFKKYPLSRYTFVPETTDDPSGFNNPVYLDASGNLIVELTNLDNSYQIEIEFQSAETNDIIY